MLVAFGDDDAERLARSGISGAVVTGWSRICRNHTTDRPPGAIRCTPHAYWGGEHLDDDQEETA